MATMHRVFTAKVSGVSGVFINEGGEQDVSIVASGNFDGGTLTAEISPDDGSTFVTSGQASLTAPGDMIITIPDGSLIRLRLAGGTTPAVNAWASHKIPSS